MDTIQRSNSYKGSYSLVFPKARNAFECEVCKYALRDDKDMKSFFEFGACTDCIDTYYYPNADKWNSGWRPSEEEVRKNDK